MRHIVTDHSNWPRRKNGSIILTSTEDALLYAQLIHHHKDLHDQITTYRRHALRLLKIEREARKLSGQRIVDLAIRAQFYRECLEEVERIHNEKATL